MPLPALNLDGRRFADLLEEGRSLIPRYAPGWTDHNAHDPGITLMELLAWVVEQDLYRANRVPERHRRKFLALTGVEPEPARPARAAVSFTLRGAQPRRVPAGLALAAGARDAVRFLTLAPVTVTRAAIRAVQSFDGQSFADETPRWREGVDFAALGEDPGAAGEEPALYVGLDPPATPADSLSIWVEIAGRRAGDEEREAIRAEAAGHAARCRPLRSERRCPGDEVPPPAGDPGGSAAASHHSVRTVWEHWAGGAWQPCESDDRTRALTLSGSVTLGLSQPMAKSRLGEVTDALYWLRCRVESGRHDSAPEIEELALHATEAVQALPVRSTLPIRPGVVPAHGVTAQTGTIAPVWFELDEQRRVSALSFEAGAELMLIEYRAATPSLEGSLTVEGAVLGRGSGLPDQRLPLPEAPVSLGRVDLFGFTAGTPGAERWSQRRDLDATGRTDRAFMLAPDAAELRFGNGARGAAPQEAELLVASYEATRAGSGNAPPGAPWGVSAADRALNAAALGGDPALLEGALASISSRLGASGGADPEELAEAAGRAAELLWAHERLLELADEAGSITLDGRDLDVVLARSAPERASSLLDFERLALETPGTAIARARAWAGVDPDFPGMLARGTVTVVVVPSLPAARPEPTAQLLDAVWRYLYRRRTLGTRLRVVGPCYVEVAVRLTVRAKRGHDPQRVSRSVADALWRFLDPLRGGPAGRGWPFGRDVHRSEILRVVDEAEGVDHVESLTLRAGAGEERCDNVCVPADCLVAAAAPEVEVTA